MAHLSPKELINASFLLPHQKEELYNLLDGDSEEFYKHFNETLILQMKHLESSRLEKVEHFTQGIQELEKKLHEDLADLSQKTSNIIQNNQTYNTDLLWDDYYKTQEALYQKYIQDTRDVISKIIINSI